MVSERHLAPVPSDQEPQPLVVTPGYIESTQRSLALLHQLVTEVLVKDRDYGSVPSVPGEFLWDPGASQIIAAFNCHVGNRRILSYVDDGRKIAFVVEVPIIHNTSGQEVGSGIGAASTLETKHKYRWVEDPLEWGYPEASIKTLKTRDKYERFEYRILNPEHDELLNTLAKISSKRAEVDAATALPGVAGALRDLFKHRQPQGKRPDIDENSPRWTSFWSQVKALLGNIAEEKGVELSALVHQMLGVTSMKVWLKGGKSLDDAVRVLAEKVGPKPESKIKPREDWDKYTQEEISTYGQLELVFQKLTGKEVSAIYKELGVSDRSQVSISPWDAFLTLKELFAPAKIKE